eukprot:3719798-Heterocapsa_arctica.AAC.1
MRGRATLLWCRKITGKTMVIANVHVVPNMGLGNKKALLRRLHAALPDRELAFSFLAGDWNFPAAGELRTNLLTGMP